MSDVVDFVEEFYNSCHTKSDGRFCGTAAKGKGVVRVPMSAKAAANYKRAAEFKVRKNKGLKREAAAAVRKMSDSDLHATHKDASRANYGPGGRRKSPYSKRERDVLAAEVARRAKGGAQAATGKRKLSDDSVPKAKGSDDRFIRKDVKGIAPVTGRKIGTSKTDHNANRVNDGAKETAFKRSKLGAEFEKAENQRATAKLQSGMAKLSAAQKAAATRAINKEIAATATKTKRSLGGSKAASTRATNKAAAAASPAVKAAVAKASSPAAKAAASAAKLKPSLRRELKEMTLAELQRGHAELTRANNKYDAPERTAMKDEIRLRYSTSKY